MNMAILSFPMGTDPLAMSLTAVVVRTALYETSQGDLSDNGRFPDPSMSFPMASGIRNDIDERIDITVALDRIHARMREKYTKAIKDLIKKSVKIPRKFDIQVHFIEVKDHGWAGMPPDK